MSRQKRCRRRLLLLLLLLLTVGNVVLLQLRIAPMLRKIAENQVVNAASEAIFRAVTRQLQTGSVDYSRIIGLEKDASGKVSALTTDMEQIARLKSEILTLLDEELAKMNDEEISVPVGSLLFPTFFAGRGFSIPVRVLALNSTNADFYSQIQSLGINQSVQQIRITFTVSLSVSHAGRNSGYGRDKRCAGGADDSPRRCAGELFIPWLNERKYPWKHKKRFLSSQESSSTRGFYTT